MQSVLERLDFHVEYFTDLCSNDLYFLFLFNHIPVINEVVHRRKNEDYTGVENIH